MTLLQVDALKVSFFIHAGEVKAVRGVSFTLNRGEALAIVGESGCGKTVTAQALMRLLPDTARKTGSISFAGEEINSKSEMEMQNIRGNDISMIFQDPMTSLNPTMTVGNQIMEAFTLHKKTGKTQAKKRALEMLRIVGFSSPERCLDQYPHELSGGMRQRVMIAMALACEPKMLIADEPTTALDVTIQAQILEMIKDLQSRLHMSIILITHDLGIVAQLCTRVLVMYAGTIVESANIEDIFCRPQHPYSFGLLKCIPHLGLETKKRLVPIGGQPPDLIQPPRGCAFAARCRHALTVCLEAPPPFFAAGEGHLVSCWLLHPYAKNTLDEEVRGLNEAEPA